MKKYNASKIKMSIRLSISIIALIAVVVMIKDVKLPIVYYIIYPLPWFYEIYRAYRHKDDYISFNEQKVILCNSKKTVDYIWIDIEKYYFFHYKGCRKLHIITFDKIKYTYDISFLSCSDDEFYQSWNEALELYKNMYSDEKNKTAYAYLDTDQENKDKLKYVASIVLVIITFLIISHSIL